MLVMVLAILVTINNYHFTLASGSNVQKMSTTSTFYHQNSKIVTNFKSPTSLSLLSRFESKLSIIWGFIYYRVGNERRSSSYWVFCWSFVPFSNSNLVKLFFFILNPFSWFIVHTSSSDTNPYNRLSTDGFAIRVLLSRDRSLLSSN